MTTENAVRNSDIKAIILDYGERFLCLGPIEEQNPPNGQVFSDITISQFVTLYEKNRLALRYVSDLTPEHIGFLMQTNQASVLMRGRSRCCEPGMSRCGATQNPAMSRVA